MGNSHTDYSDLKSYIDEQINSELYKLVTDITQLMAREKEKGNMDWEDKLKLILSVLGDEPTELQLENLESFVLREVPSAFWSELAFSLPGKLQTVFRMRSAELGLF